jgi:hypothetical protein
LDNFGGKLGQRPHPFTQKRHVFYGPATRQRIPERLRDQNGWGVYHNNLHHCAAYGHSPPLVGLFGIYVCGRAIASHYESAMDRADISFVDVVNQHLHSDIGVSS